MAPNNKPKRKRGVILLIVVSLLALFVLIGVTYAVLATNYLTATKLDVRREEYGDAPEKEFDLVLGQLLRDVSARSALKNHSLLGDLYGPPTFDDDSDSNTNDNTKVLTTAGAGNNFQWGGQAYAFQVRPAALQTNGGPLSDTLDYYSGRLLTFTEGPARNYTARILQYDPTLTTGPQFLIEIDHSAYGTFGQPGVDDHFLINGAPFNGAGAGYDLFTYNMDAVYANSQSIDLTGMLPPGTIAPPVTDLVALLPHFNGFDPTHGRIYMNPTATPPQVRAISDSSAGGANETWDAVDFQNMFLAMEPPTAALTYTNATANMPILPSYHRPELVNYWVEFIKSQILGPMPAPGNLDPNDPVQFARMYTIMALPYGVDGIRGNSDDPAEINVEQRDRVYNLTRGCIFRPMPFDQANFTGSNQMFDVASIRAAIPQNINEPQRTGEVYRFLFNALINAGNQPLWDVDNNNDGVPDSIWVDAGLPVITATDGRRYKRLVAILIKDLDGRIDLNAHGNLMQIAPTLHPRLTAQYGANKFVGTGSNDNRADTQLTVAFGLANTAPLPFLPRGIGFGPAEVDFRNILGGDSLAYGELLTQRYQSNTVYIDPGPDGITGTMDDGATYRDRFLDENNDGIVDARPGVPGGRDGLNIVKHHGVPNQYPTFGGWYSSPPDVWGRGAYVLDYGGQPLSAYSGVAGEMLDNPYEISLSDGLNNADSPYTLVELERLLRFHDPDAQQLPSQRWLAAAAYLNSTPGIVDVNHANRERFRTHGAHLPVPEFVPPGNAGATQLSRQNSLLQPGSTTILDMYRERIALAAAPAQRTAIFHQLVPWELRHGTKFDLNRWFGDGFDSSVVLDGAADDPMEGFQYPGSGPPFAGPRERAWLGGSAGFTGINAEHVNGMDVNNDGVSADTPVTMTFTQPMKDLAIARDRMLARQLYARQLFCLAMLFFDDDPDNNGSGFNAPFPHELGLHPPTPANSAARRELFIRRIAQWVVNVVDFRDSDSIMTPFEYDVNPWNGWDVDSNPATDGTAGSPELRGPGDGTLVPHPWPGSNERRLVWGMEHPELLITETFAFHSRNIRDTNTDNTGEDREGGDDDPDQIRVPQGSLYFELYNTRARQFAGQQGNQKPRLPIELYDFSGPGLPRLALGKVAPGGWPVWRVGLSALSNADFAYPDDIKPLAMAMTNPETASFEPTVPASVFGPPSLEPARDVNLLAAFPGATPTGIVPLDRFVWFTTPANATGPAGNLAVNNHSFYSNGNVNPGVEPGQYAIVGPRLTTYIGSRNPDVNFNTHDPPPVAEWGGWSPQRLEMGPTGLTVYDTTLQAGTSTTPPVGNVIRNAVPIIADIIADGTVAPLPNGWTTPPRWNIGLNITEPLPSGTYYPEPPDLSPYPMWDPNYPQDGYDDLDGPTGTFLDTPADYSRLLGDNNMIATDTYQDVASIYLQRLANPNLPWNALTNPYMTVDWAAVDVSVFAGDENTNRRVMINNVATDLETLDPVDDTGRPMNWETRQRGNRPPPAIPPQPTKNPWPPVTVISAAATGRLNAGMGGELYFDIDMAAKPLAMPPTPLRHSLSWLNQALGTPMSSPPDLPTYVGEVQSNAVSLETFPWLAHLDRPLANPFELLQVSSSSPSRFFTEVTPGFQFATNINVYNTAPPPPQPESLRAPFAHLLNFFHSNANPNASPQLQRLLDFVEVPSPYAGAERWYNPGNFGAAGLFRPPFNKLSRFRDSGRININTIFDSLIWDGAVGQFPGMNSTNPVVLDRFLRSRRGFAGPSYLAQTDSSGNPVPTLFGNPIRSTDAADLMPMGFGFNMRQPNPVNATLLRPSPDDISKPLFDHTPADTYRNTQRNAYFRYQALQKLGNTFTTHSNVFAVWMTMGYFEVENNTDASGNVVINAAHPDGLRLSAEIGADSGEIVRHRFFAIIDRSVPVGYAHGQKLNTDNCVLLRRVIE